MPEKKQKSLNARLAFSLAQPWDARVCLVSSLGRFLVV